jgi:hypothetical protein
MKLNKPPSFLSLPSAFVRGVASAGGFLSSFSGSGHSNMDEPLTGAAAGADVPAAVAANGHDAAWFAEARRLIETTIAPQTEIAAKLNVKPAALSKLKLEQGWTRPDGAPVGPPAGMSGWQVASRPEAVAKKKLELVARLYRPCDKQLKSLETQLVQLARDGTGLEEKDVRTLGLLAKTLGTLMALDRDDGAKLRDAEPVDRDELNAELARRIARWAEGREESE